MLYRGLNWNTKTFYIQKFHFVCMFFPSFEWPKFNIFIKTYFILNDLNSLSN